jgi:hypothetical protein
MSIIGGSKQREHHPRALPEHGFGLDISQKRWKDSPSPYAMGTRGTVFIKTGVC